MPFLFNDLLLIMVVISSMAAAIIFPDFGSKFKTFPFYCLMINFFLSYLSIDLTSIWKAFTGHKIRILSFTVMKLVLLPVIFYHIFSFIAPNYALSALLLTGVSVGVASPIISNMVRGNSSLVLVVVLVTSMLTPVTLPTVVKFVTSKETAISLPEMMQRLAAVIFIPMVAVEIIRHAAPKLAKPIMKIRFPLLLAMFAMINLGVFHEYASFFRQEPTVILTAVLVAFVLALTYFLVGIISFKGSSLENRLAGAVMMVNINNVLVIVFSSRFFGPIEPMVAAMYMIPFFVVVIPLRYYRSRKIRRTILYLIQSGAI